jgi:hypothetical protein
MVAEALQLAVPAEGAPRPALFSCRSHHADPVLLRQCLHQNFKENRGYPVVITQKQMGLLLRHCQQKPHTAQSASNFMTSDPGVAFIRYSK